MATNETPATGDRYYWCSATHAAQLATANAETARLGRELEEARAARDKYAGTLPRRFHVLFDGIIALGWKHPAPHDSKQAPEWYALEWLASELARIDRLRALATEWERRHHLPVGGSDDCHFATEHRGGARCECGCHLIAARAACATHHDLTGGASDAG